MHISIHVPCHLHECARVRHQHHQLGDGLEERVGEHGLAPEGGIISAAKTVAPSWTKKIANCPKCQAANDKSEVHARQEQKPYWKRWNCRGCHKQTWASAWKCECGKLIPQCGLHSQDPESHRTINHRWLHGRAGREVDEGLTADPGWSGTAVVGHRQ